MLMVVKTGREGGGLGTEHVSLSVRTASTPETHSLRHPTQCEPHSITNTRHPHSISTTQSNHQKSKSISSISSYKSSYYASYSTPQLKADPRFMLARCPFPFPSPPCPNSHERRPLINVPEPPLERRQRLALTLCTVSCHQVQAGSFLLLNSSAAKARRARGGISQHDAFCPCSRSRDQTFHPCSFANCSQACNELGQSHATMRFDIASTTHTFAGFPTFCPMTFHLLFS